MATIVKRASGVYQARIRVSGYKSVSKNFNSKQSAQRWAVIAEDEIKRGIYREQTADKPAPTLEKALLRYRREITPRKKGRDVEVHVINTLLASELSPKPLSEITVKDVSRWRDGLLKDKAASTVNKRISLLSHLFKVAISEWDIPLSNPCDNVIKPVVRNSRNRVASEAEFMAVLSALNGEELKAIAKLARFTGMRLGEILAAKWCNVNFHHSTLHLPDTKNGESRTVPLSPRAVSVLTAWGRLNGRGEYLFSMGRQQVSKRWAYAVMKARRNYEATCAIEGKSPEPEYLVNLHLHDLRHSAISELAGAGLNTIELSRISGHKTLAMLSRYIHIKPEQLAQKLATLEV